MACEKCGDTPQICPQCVRDWIEDAKDGLRDEFNRKLSAIRERLGDLEKEKT